VQWPDFDSRQVLTPTALSSITRTIQLGDFPSVTIRAVHSRSMAASHQKTTSTPELSALPRPLVSSSRRVPELDGLRGVAILLVLIYHGISDVLPPSGLPARLMAVGRLGWSGVDLFFVLSGFLIGGILLDVRPSPNYFKTFYLRRAYRILPIYGVSMVLFSLRFIRPGGVASLGVFSQSPIPWLSYVTFTQNLWMAALGSFGVGALAATWSLAVEEQFYLTAPLIVRKVDPKRLVLILLMVVAGSPLLRTVLY